MIQKSNFLSLNSALKVLWGKDKLCRRTPIVLLNLFLLTGMLGAGTLHAGSLPLPAEAKSILSAVEVQCPECLTKGLVPSGNGAQSERQTESVRWSLDSDGAGFLK
jgi:hypothetical protein